MAILALAKGFSTHWLLTAASLGLSLRFSPIRLLLLLGWVYLCLYFVQRVQFSPLVPNNRKSIANIATLITGPLLLLLLSIVDSIRSYLYSERGMLEVIKEGLKNMARSARSPGFVSSQDHSRIMLLDSSGRSIKEVYGSGKGWLGGSSTLKLTAQIVLGALEDRASDILIDPKDESTYTVRYRVDGVLRTAYEIKANVSKAVINSIKAVAEMDIAERRRPQDGSFVAETPQMKVSIRVASAGVRDGEKLSLRLLNQDMSIFTLDTVGFTEKQRLILENAIAKPSGMLLLCGPTGSGKTTTMYAMLNEIDLFTRNVITIEDPIEYTLPNASQIEVNPKADITFAKSLRSVLRQDPDVICVGEIRDEETASIALRASQTGHLVLATLHCNTNASALVRLLDLGISPLLISSGLNLIATQRLLRRLCSYCKVPAELSQSQMHDLRRRHINCTGIFQAVGCDECNETGYRGRIAVCDMWVFNEKLKASITSSESLIAQLREEGDKKGKSNLQKQGMRAVVFGVTSLEELKRVIG